jgi:hypothetical protein
MAWAYNAQPYQPYQETPYPTPGQQPPNGQPPAPWNPGSRSTTWGGPAQTNNWANNSGVVNPAANPYNPYGSWTAPPWWPGAQTGGAAAPPPGAPPSTRPVTGFGAPPGSGTGTGTGTGTGAPPPPAVQPPGDPGPTFGAVSYHELANGAFDAPSTPTYLQGPTAAMFGAPPQPPGTTHYNLTAGRWE